MNAWDQIAARRAAWATGLSAFSAIMAVVNFALLWILGSAV